MVVVSRNGERLAEWTGDEERIVEAIHSNGVEVRDSKGKLIGKVVPASETAKEPFWPPDPTYTYEDAIRDARQGPHYTLEEIWKELGAK